MITQEASRKIWNDAHDFLQANPGERVILEFMNTTFMHRARQSLNKARHSRRQELEKGGIMGSNPWDNLILRYDEEKAIIWFEWVASDGFVVKTSTGVTIHSSQYDTRQEENPLLEREPQEFTAPLLDAEKYERRQLELAANFTIASLGSKEKEENPAE